MGKAEIIEILRAYKKEFAKINGIIEIGVFGSVAKFFHTQLSHLFHLSDPQSIP